MALAHISLKVDGVLVGWLFLPGMQTQEEEVLWGCWSPKAVMGTRGSDAHTRGPALVLPAPGSSTNHVTRDSASRTTLPSGRGSFPLI